MSFKKFEDNDIFNNIIKAKPRFEFKIYGGNIYLNNGEGFDYLNKLNLPIEVCEFPYAFVFSCEINSYNIAMI
jgi:hypothetical protein